MNRKQGKERSNYDRRIYAVYRGDEYVMDGTLDEIAAALHRTRKHLQWFLTPACRRRQAQQKDEGHRLVLVRLDDGETED